MDTTELSTRARVESSALPTLEKQGGSPEIMSATIKGPLQFLSQHGAYSIVNNTELTTRARARVEISSLPTLEKSGGSPEILSATINGLV